jgi:hypothetical protein
MGTRVEELIDHITMARSTIKLEKVIRQIASSYTVLSH